MRDRQHQANGDNRDTPSGSEGVGKAEIDFQSSLRSSAWVQPEASRNEPSSRVVKGLTNPLLVKTRTQFQILKPTQDARSGNSCAKRLGTGFGTTQNQLRMRKVVVFAYPSTYYTHILVRLRFQRAIPSRILVQRWIEQGDSRWLGCLPCLLKKLRVFWLSRLRCSLTSV